MGLSIEEQREKRRERRREERVEFIKENSTKGMKTKHKTNMFCTKGIYYLYLNNKIVYIGMSDSNCLKRISDHYTDGKVFDNFEIHPKRNVSKTQLLSMEAAKIRKHKPIYNKVSKK